MAFARHPDFRLQRLTVGREGRPLLVIDNLAANPDELVAMATSKQFGAVASYYPGVRAKVPLTWQQFILDQFRNEFAEVFGMNAGSLRFTACHFSVVTTLPHQLTYIQRIPHIDSLASGEIALVHYLFRADLGGTAFYRQRATGFEYIDDSRRADYWRHVEQEQAAVEQTQPAYIDASTPFYDQIGRQQGVFNRMLVYRRNSLHSGDVGPHFTGDPDPRKGRLSINGFLA